MCNKPTKLQFQSILHGKFLCSQNTTNQPKSTVDLLKLALLAAIGDLFVVMVLRLLFTGLFLSGLWRHDFLSDKTANCRAGLRYNKTTPQNSEQCRMRVEQNSYKVVQMLLFVAVTRSISRTCRADVVRMSHRRRTYVTKTRRQTRTRWREFLHREKRGEITTYTRCMYEFMRHLYDICPTCEMKTRTRILNRLKFSPLLAEYLRHPETSDM